MANLEQRLDEIEKALEVETTEQTVFVVLVETERDLHEMPTRAEDWLTYQNALAAAEPARYGPRVVLLDSGDERRARAEATARN